MCYYKSLAQKLAELESMYSASFESITEDVEYIKERFTILLSKNEQLAMRTLKHVNEINDKLIEYSQKDKLPAEYTKQELAEMKWCLKTLSRFTPDGYQSYMENGFDYLATPIVTAGDPAKFKLFKWGLIPYYMKERDKAMILRTQTLNCISEEMYDKPSFRDAAKNGQRCLIPVTGFFEWRWLDEAGTVKIPYYVTFRDQKVRSMAGLYSRWKDPDTGEYYYSYTVLTTRANTILEYVHNNKKRMPVFIPKDAEKAWLSKDLSKNDVLDLCQPFQDPAMRAYTISKLLTTKNINTNVPEVLQPKNYQAALQETEQYLRQGEKKKAIETFKSAVAGDLKLADVENAVKQEIRAELSLA